MLLNFLKNYHIVYFKKVMCKECRRFNFSGTEKNNSRYKTILLKQIFTCAYCIYVYIISGLITWYWICNWELFPRECYYYYPWYSSVSCLGFRSSEPSTFNVSMSMAIALLTIYLGGCVDETSRVQLLWKF